MSEQKMFFEDEPRYVTRGIQERLPVLYQILLWSAVDGLRDSGQQMDDLQVFRLQTKDNPDRKGKWM